MNEDLIPQIAASLRRLPRDQVLGSGEVLARDSIAIEDVKADTIYADVTVQTRASGKKGTVVLRAWAGKVKFVSGDYRSAVVVEVNGAFTAGELLGGHELGVGGLGTYKHEPLRTDGRTYQFLPFSIYTQLLHELTHIADTFNPKVDYYNDDKTLNDARYYNHPGEVRAFMQTMVDEAINHGHKLKEHLRGSPQRLINTVLRLSSEWKVIEPHLNAQNRARILKAIYSALVDEGILAA